MKCEFCPNEARLRSHTCGEWACQVQRRRKTREAIRQWRAANPTYNRDKMRHYRSEARLREVLSVWG